MNEMIDRSGLLAEIAKRAPWYQRIAFPEYGVTTTDDPAWMFADPAWDNLFPGMIQTDAARLRPLPKFERLQQFLPAVEGRSVLEVGSACGFFAFEFCRRGAARVTGLDISETNVEKARFCADVLKLPQARFVSGDLGLFIEPHDVVWVSSLHQQLFFPFYYFTRLMCLAREALALETHHYVRDDPERVCRLDLDTVNPVGSGSHGFHFSRTMFLDYLKMLGVDSSAIEERVFYDDGVVRRLILYIDTKEFQRRRKSHGYLRPLDDIA